VVDAVAANGLDSTFVTETGKLLSYPTECVTTTIPKKNLYKKPPAHTLITKYVLIQHKV